MERSFENQGPVDRGTVPEAAGPKDKARGTSRGRSDRPRRATGFTILLQRFPTSGVALRGRRLVRGRGGRDVQGLDAPFGLDRRPATSSISASSRIRSMTLRSRIWVASESAPPSFSTRARTRRTLSSVRAAIASISSARSSSSTLISSASAILAAAKFLERPEGRLVGVGADLGFAGPDLVVGHALPLQLRDQPLIVLFSSRNQVGGKLERRLPEQLVEDLPAHRLALLGTGSGAPGSRAPPRAARPMLSKPIESRNAWFSSGSRSRFRSLTRTCTRDRRSAQLGIVDRRAELGLDLARLARPGSHERRADPAIVPFWNRSSD